MDTAYQKTEIVPVLHWTAEANTKPYKILQVMRAGSKIMLYSENIQRLIFLGDVEQKKPSGISSVNPSSLIEGSELLKWLLICKKVLNLRSLPRVQYQKGKKKKRRGGKRKTNKVLLCTQPNFMHLCWCWHFLWKMCILSGDTTYRKDNFSILLYTYQKACLKFILLKCQSSRRFFHLNWFLLERVSCNWIEKDSSSQT